MGKILTLMSLGILLSSPIAMAGESDFKTGPVFDRFGPTAKVNVTMNIPQQATFAIAFDTAKSADAGEINRTLESAARFINMHVAAGVPEENIKIAVIIHGKASFDVSAQDIYGGRNDGAINANTAAVKALTDHGVRIIVCGQSAAYYGIATDDLLPGVEMALSAMTAHAILQQDGYTLNPF